MWAKGAAVGNARRPSAALSTVAPGAPKAHRPHVHSLPGAQRPALGAAVSSGRFDFKPQPSGRPLCPAGEDQVLCLLRAPCLDSSLQRSQLRLACIGIGSCSRQASISSLAVAAGSVISQPSTTGQASSKGSSRVLHHRCAVELLRCVGRTSPFFQAVASPSRNADTSGTAGVDVPMSCGPCATISLSICWAARMSCNRRTGSRPLN